jgi:hypothetical protein
MGESAPPSAARRGTVVQGSDGDALREARALRARSSLARAERLAHSLVAGRDQIHTAVLRATASEVELLLVSVRTDLFGPEPAGTEAEAEAESHEQREGRTDGN